MRRIISVLIPVAIAMAASPHASAGGSWLEVVSRESHGAGGSGSWFVWGTPGGTLALRAVGEAWPAETYDVYLLATTGGQRLRVGSATTFQPTHAVGGLRTTFVLPDVAPGAYTVLVCPPADQACTDPATQGWVTIDATPRLARLSLTVASLRARVEALQRSTPRGGQIRRLEARLDRVATELEETRDELRSLEDRQELIESQRDVANQQARDAQREIGASRDEAASWRLATYLILIVVSAAGCLLLIRRRRYVHVRIPDSPRELLEPSPRPRERS